MRVQRVQAALRGACKSRCMAQSARKKVSGERGLPKNQCFFADKIMQYHEKNEKIVETNKLNTALILKAFKEKEEQFKTVL